MYLCMKKHKNSSGISVTNMFGCSVLDDGSKFRRSHDTVGFASFYFQLTGSICPTNHLLLYTQISIIYFVSRGNNASHDILLPSCNSTSARALILKCIKHQLTSWLFLKVVYLWYFMLHNPLIQLRWMTLSPALINKEDLPHSLCYVKG